MVSLNIILSNLRKLLRRIGFDGDLLSSGMTGIGNYCFHLLKALCELDSELEFWGFGGWRWKRVDSSDLDRIDYLHGKKLLLADERAGYAQHIWQVKNALKTQISQIDRMRTLYRQLRSWKFSATSAVTNLQLFHAFKYIPVGDLSVPVLPVVHDLSFVRHPEVHPRQRLKDLESLSVSLALAKRIQTVSAFSKSEIVSVYGISSDKIVVAPPAASDIFHACGVAATQAALRRFSLTIKGYFLAVGTLEPRKNLKTLIAAFSKFTPAQRMQAPLVIVGRAGWGELELPHQTQALKREGTLIFVGAVTDVQLRSLYEGALALVFPSIYEGFGMPVVEALACGTRVAHSSATAMDEITGYTDAVRIPALNVDGWHAALVQILDERRDDEEALRVRQNAAGQFSWRQSAMTVRAAYLDVMGS